MIDSWHLAEDRLILQQDLRVNTLTHVLLSASPPQVKQLNLPANLVVSRPIAPSVDKLAGRHPLPNKEVLKAKIKDVVGA